MLKSICSFAFKIMDRIPRRAR